MAQRLRGDEQYLLDTVADFLTQMTELERLREAVRLAEAAAKGEPSRELPRQVVNSKVVDLFAEAQVRVYPTRALATPDQLSKG
jgi:hypothetical protein